MGRRISINLTCVLFTALLAPALSAQTPSPESLPADPPLASPEKIGTPLSLQDDLPPVAAPPESQELSAPKSAPAKKAKSNPAPNTSELTTKNPNPEAIAPPTDPASLPALTPKTLAPHATAVLDEPVPFDNRVVRTAADGTPATPPPAKPAPVTAAANKLPEPGADNSDSLATDRLPLGKQSLAVTVDVQSPPTMNLNQVATLKLIVKNIGSDDASEVAISDILPDGVEFQSSQTSVTPINKNHLLWRIHTLAANSERVILFKVKPTKKGSFDHAATVTFQTGSKARTIVHQPQLKVDQTVSTPNVLKGQQVEFKVAVTNIGDGPARNVAIQAKLSPGLRPGSVKSGDEHMMYELTLPELASGQREELDPLVADALLGGEQSCTVIATSQDVIPHNKETAENVKTVNVVEPKLKVALVGPETRVTDSIATYKIALANPGTAPARKVNLVVTLPVSGRLVSKPSDAVYDSATRRLKWNLDQLDAGGKPQNFSFDFRMGGVGSYQVNVEARGEGTLSAKDRRMTEVEGMADVDLVVSERKRVVDIGGKTVFQIKLSNYGTKEATNVKVKGKLSANLSISSTAGLEGDQSAKKNPDNEFELPVIEKLGAGKARILAIEVQVKGDDPKLGTCKVSVTHDGLTEPFEDMAFIKIMPSTRSETVTITP